MHTRPDWIERNLTLRQLGLPVLEDAQHAAMASMPGLAERFDQQTQGLLDNLDDLTPSVSYATRDPAMRWVAAMLAEVAWRAPATSQDLYLDQMALLDRMKLICRDTLELMKSPPPVLVELHARATPSA